MVQVFSDALGQAMNEAYRTFHPRWYRRRVPIFWWLRQLAYIKFISRELTSIAVGYGAILLLTQIWAASHSQETYNRFVGIVTSTPMVVLNLVVLVALIFHSLTWLHLAPKALVLYAGGRRIPESLVLLGHYFGWVLASGFVVWFLRGGQP